MIFGGVFRLKTASPLDCHLPRELTKLKRSRSSCHLEARCRGRATPATIKRVICIRGLTVLKGHEVLVQGQLSATRSQKNSHRVVVREICGEIVSVYERHKKSSTRTHKRVEMEDTKIPPSFLSFTLAVRCIYVFQPGAHADTYVCISLLRAAVVAVLLLAAVRVSAWLTAAYTGYGTYDRIFYDDYVVVFDDVRIVSYVISTESRLNTHDHTTRHAAAPKLRHVCPALRRAFVFFASVCVRSADYALLFFGAPSFLLCTAHTRTTTTRTKPWNIVQPSQKFVGSSSSSQILKHNRQQHEYRLDKQDNHARINCCTTQAGTTQT